MRLKLPHTVTVWRNPVSNRVGGFTFDTPETIDARWQDRAELFGDREGRQLMSKAIIYTKDGIGEGDMVALGDETETSNPYLVSGALTVRSVQRWSDIQGRHQYLKAMVLQG